MLGVFAKLITIHDMKTTELISIKLLVSKTEDPLSIVCDNVCDKYASENMILGRADTFILANSDDSTAPSGNMFYNTNAEMESFTKDTKTTIHPFIFRMPPNFNLLETISSKNDSNFLVFVVDNMNPSNVEVRSFDNVPFEVGEYLPVPDDTEYIYTGMGFNQYYQPEYSEIYPRNSSRRYTAYVFRYNDYQLKNAPDDTVAMYNVYIHTLADDKILEASLKMYSVDNAVNNTDVHTYAKIVYTVDEKQNRINTVKLLISTNREELKAFTESVIAKCVTDGNRVIAHCPVYEFISYPSNESDIDQVTKYSLRNSLIPDYEKPVYPSMCMYDREEFTDSKYDGDFRSPSNYLVILIDSKDIIDLRVDLYHHVPEVLRDDMIREQYPKTSYNYIGISRIDMNGITYHVTNDKRMNDYNNHVFVFKYFPKAGNTAGTCDIITAHIPNDLYYHDPYTYLNMVEYEKYCPSK